jgi:serine/threonine protein kinase
MSLTAEASGINRQITSAVNYLHQIGIAHRDLYVDAEFLLRCRLTL